MQPCSDPPRPRPFVAQLRLNMSELEVRYASRGSHELCSLLSGMGAP
jgi:hypothetical protein